MEERIEYRVLAPNSVAWFIQAALTADRSGNAHSRDLALAEAQRVAAERRLVERPAPDGSRVLAYVVAHECNGVRLAEIERRLDALEKQQREQSLVLGGHAQWMDATDAELGDQTQRFLKVKLRVDAGLPGADQMHEQYDAEHDAATISYWDMKLLAMIETTNSRLAAAIGGG